MDKEFLNIPKVSPSERNYLKLKTNYRLTTMAHFYTTLKQAKPSTKQLKESSLNAGKFIYTFVPIFQVPEKNCSNFVESIFMNMFIILMIIQVADSTRARTMVRRLQCNSASARLSTTRLFLDQSGICVP